MSFNQAIFHKKEHRKQYTDSRYLFGSCRCHGKCSRCYSNRVHRYEKKREAADQRLKEFEMGED